MKPSDIFSSKYLSAADLRERDATVTIEGATIEKMQNGEKKLALTFRGKEKGFLVNRTNFNSIAEALGTDETDDWEGQQITIYPSETDFQGKTVDCIRVRRKKASTAPQAPAMPASEPAWTAPSTEPLDDDIPF